MPFLFAKHAMFIDIIILTYLFIYLFDRTSYHTCSLFADCCAFLCDVCHFKIRPQSTSVNGTSHHLSRLPLC